MIPRWPALLCILLAGPAAAQVEDNDQTIAYYNRLTTGILAGGEHGLITGTATTIHGISVGHLAVGAGVGIEGYERWRTVPIFGSLTYFLKDARASGMFLQINAGHSVCRLIVPDEGFQVDGTRGGFMFSTVAGYQIAAGKLLVNLSAGYKLQNMRGAYKNGQLPNLNFTLDEQADRFVFQIGVGL